MNILVIRFSALGDVALASIAVETVLKANPSVNIWFLSKPFHEPLFNEDKRFQFIGADLKNKHKGLVGLRKLTKETLESTKIDAVVDLHDVIRTKILLHFFRKKGIKVYSFSKGRKEKKNMLNGKIPFKKLTHSVNRYLNCFQELGLNTALKDGPWLKTDNKLNKPLNKKLIGIAPFTAHKSKEWGFEKITKLIEQLTHLDILLFGGGENEIIKLNQLAKKFPNCKVIAGKYSLKEELDIMANLDLMISMDSANMHLATLVGIKVISIWGPTHHFLGFGPLMNEALIVEINRKEMPCRPCSIYGKTSSSKQEKCAKNAMKKISVDTVLSKINTAL